MEKFIIKIFWDDEATGWVAVCDEIPLTLYADTIEHLMQEVRETAPEIIESNSNKPMAEPIFSYLIEERLCRAI